MNVTEYLKSNYPGYEKDLEEELEAMVESRSYCNDPKYAHIPADGDPEEVKNLIRKIWNEMKEGARDLTIEMQQMIFEYFRSGQIINDNPLLQHEKAEFQRFVEAKHKYLQTLKFYDNEVPVEHSSTGLPGIINTVFKDKNNNWVLFSWKRPGIDTFDTDDEETFYFKDPKLQHYVRQLNLYRSIVQSNGNLVSGMKLWIIDTKQPNTPYRFIDVPTVDNI